MNEPTKLFKKFSKRASYIKKLRKLGYSYRDIGDAIGVPFSYAWKICTNKIGCHSTL